MNKNKDLLIRLTKSLISKEGNLKIGKDTLIYNLSPAKYCPSDKLKLCGISKECYAKKAEKQYPKVLEYRKLQQNLWKIVSTEIFVDAIFDLNRTKKRFHYLRFNESGDVENQQDINKIIDIANKLESHNIKVYLYTKRSDLDWTDALSVKNLTINGSGFMLNNNFLVIESIKQFNYKTDKFCNQDCTLCNLCKQSSNNIIKILIH